MQQGTDSNNSNRLNNASAVLGSYAQKLEDPQPQFEGRFAYQPPSQAAANEQKALQKTTDPKTGEYVYNTQLVDQTYQWLLSNGLVS